MCLLYPPPPPPSPLLAVHAPRSSHTARKHDNDAQRTRERECERECERGREHERKQNCERVRESDGEPLYEPDNELESHNERRDVIAIISIPFAAIFIMDVIAVELVATPVPAPPFSCVCSHCSLLKHHIFTCLQPVIALCPLEPALRLQVRLRRLRHRLHELRQRRLVEEKRRRE